LNSEAKSISHADTTLSARQEVIELAAAKRMRKNHRRVELAARGGFVNSSRALRPMTVSMALPAGASISFIPRAA